MKIKLKTEFWNSKLNSEWRDKINKIIIIMQLFALANAVVGVIIWNVGLIILNVCVLTIGLMMQRTKVLWEKENEK